MTNVIQFPTKRIRHFSPSPELELVSIIELAKSARTTINTNPNEYLRIMFNQLTGGRYEQ